MSHCLSRLDNHSPLELLSHEAKLYKRQNSLGVLTSRTNQPIPDNFFPETGWGV